MTLSEQDPSTPPPAPAPSDARSAPVPESPAAPAAPAPSDAPALGRLLQDLASEMNLLGHGFAAASGLHATDVQALLAVMRAGPDRVGGQGGITPAGSARSWPSPRER